MEQVRNVRTYKLPLDELHNLAPDISWGNAPTISSDLSPIEVCQIVGEWYAAHSSEARRHNAGQFFTPAIVARYMVNVAGILHNDTRILDPGAGVGILACATCEAAIVYKLTALSIVAYESDPVLHALCSFTLNYAREKLHEHGIELSIELYLQDFIEAMAEEITQISLWSSGPRPRQPFDLAILNPPYFKVNQTDIRARLVKDIAHGRTNMYTMFMSLAASSLRVGGHFVSITPRSFASGAYFRRFRQQFFGAITPELIHVFESRRSAFEDANVLQENIIIAGVRKGITSVSSPFVTISRSRGLDDLAHPLIQQVQRRLIIDDKQKDPLFHLPTSDIDTHLLQAFRRWNNRLATYGLEISTGPVVPFRALDMLTSIERVKQGKAVPLLWLQHIRRMDIQWPLEHFDKSQGVLQQASPKLLVKNTTQIILRRFSAKEEPRRITAAVLLGGAFGTDLIALENHLNYLYRPGGTLSYEEATGIAAFLNSTLVDRYFRITNGNTQINATELRKLPLPPWEQLTHIGQQVVDLQIEHDFDASERIVMEELGKDLIIGSEDDLQLPILKDSRISMGKIQEAQRILQELGLPPAQQNGALWEHYQRSRQALALPLKLADGRQLYLTPGKHNELQIAVIEKFGPRFAAGATVLYLGDAANKSEIYERERLEQLGVPITVHDKLPDIILLHEARNWLYLIEAVASHGPVSHKRKHELEKLLKGCTTKQVYISAFLDFREFRRHTPNIAWETEVWIAEMPQHMIHYNGEKFLGPHE